MTDRFIKYYEIGGVAFSVEAPYDYTEAPPYSLFSAGERECECRYVFRSVPSVPAPDDDYIFEDQYNRVYFDGDTIVRYIGFFNAGRVLDPPISVVRYGRENCDEIEVLIPKDRDLPENAAFIYRSLCLEHLMTAKHAVMFHSSYIKTERGAILFTAPSGTGKSTQAELWRRYRGARVINGDCSIIRRTKDGITVFGLPFSGTSGICINESAPLGGAGAEPVLRLRHATAERRGRPAVR